MKREYAKTVDILRRVSSYRHIFCRRMKRMAVFLFALLLFVSSSFFRAAAFADNFSETEAGDEGTPDRLNDSVIEWDEIDDIVMNRNPTYLLVRDSALASISDMKNAVSQDIMALHESIDEAEAAVKELKESEKKLLQAGADQNSDAYRLLEQSLDIAAALKGSLQSSLSSMHSTSRSLDSSTSSVERTLKEVRRELSAALKTLIITLKELEVQETMLDSQISLYESLYENALLLEQTGLSTASETTAYRLKLQEARDSLSTLSAASMKIRANILILSGYDMDSEAEIGALPAPDRDFLAGRDIEADRTLAVDGNPAVIDAMSVSGYTGDVFRYRDAHLNEVYAAASAAFNEIYAALSSETVLSEAAEIGCQRAGLLFEGTERQYRLGLISDAEYEALKLQYIAAYASSEIADLNLHQAIENYSYALLGIMSVG